LLVVDTNVLVYAADADSPFHLSCLAWLQRQRTRPDAWFTTWPIIYEFLRITTHARVMRTPWAAARAWSFVSALMRSPGLSVLVATPRHADVVGEVISEMPHVSGNIAHDLHTAVLMREHGIGRICTRDTDFSRFSFLEVIDPLSA
jgi:toxin-antitoxin system PIN domain toxin